MLGLFRVVENRLPSEFYAHHHLRFKREAVMGEEELRKLVGAHGFSVANLSQRLIDEGQDLRVPHGDPQPRHGERPVALPALARAARR